MNCGLYQFLGSMNFSLTFIKSLNQSSIKPYQTNERLSASHGQVNFTTYTSPLRVGKLQPKLLKVPITSSKLVSENTNTYIQQREIEYIGIILWQKFFYR